VSGERGGDGWDCCGLGAAIRWCRVARPPGTSRHPLRGAILLGVVSGGVARGLAQPPARGRHPCGMRRRGLGDRRGRWGGWGGWGEWGEWGAMRWGVIASVETSGAGAGWGGVGWGRRSGGFALLTTGYKSAPLAGWGGVMRWCAERDSNPGPTVGKTSVRVGG
jgi:hypothetical protein